MAESDVPSLSKDSQEDSQESPQESSDRSINKTPTASQSAEDTTNKDRSSNRKSVHKSTAKRQVPEQRWQIFPAQVSQSYHIAQATALSPLLAQVLINRGIYTPEQAWEFLDPETLLLPSPLDEFPDLEKSLEVLVDAIATQKKILICGDYDADGMTSTALLMRSLRYLGASVNYAIPSRMTEGYGINIRMVEEFADIGGSVVLTVDNGIAAYDPVARAKELGLTVILTDHHEVPETIPPADAILNPQLIREGSPYKGVAGVGVAYILAVCLAQRLDKMQDLTATLLALFTLGTIADLAPLTGVNRRWVKRGLKILPKSRIPGVQALIEVAGLSDENALRPESIGFRLGPRINAVGRISDPQIVIDLLTTDDVGVALQRAMQCEEANQLRRQMCEVIERQAVEWCEQQIEKGLLDLSQERVLVVVQPEWHHGVIGIVASRLVERYGVPVFIGTYEDKQKKEIRGSARSIPEFNVFEALQFCDDLLDKYGGHRAAGGFTFHANKLRQVKSRLRNFAREHLQLDHLKTLVTVDVQVPLSAVGLDLFSQIDQIHPCGIDNPEPVFWTANATVVEQKVIGKNSDHLKLTLAHQQEGDSKQSVVKAIAWRWGHYYPLPRAIDIAYKLRLNEWRGKRSVELELVGARLESLPTTDGIQPWQGNKAVAEKRSSVGPQPTRVESTTALDHASDSVLDSPTTSSIDTAPAQAGSVRTVQEAALSLHREISNSTAADAPATSEYSEPILFKLPPKLPSIKRSKSTEEAPHPSDNNQNFQQTQADTSTQEEQQQDKHPETAAQNALVGTENSLHAEFYHSKRCYKGTLDQTQQERQLTIENSEGHLLVVRLNQKQGFLYLPEVPAQSIDIGELRYFNLIRAGLSALELKQKTQLLMKQDELLAQKDRQIKTMKAQIELLEEKITQLSVEQQQQLDALKTEMQAQETNISDQEADLAQLQVQISSLPTKSAADIEQQVRQAVGDGVWFCLQADSQNDLQAAYKNEQMIYATNADAEIADYSTAGARLSQIVEREVLVPFFQDLYLFCVEQRVRTIGEIVLTPIERTIESQYGLSMMPPLLARQWRSVRSGQLSEKQRPEGGVDMVKVSAKHSLSKSDRTILNQFLAQWEHPMATCLSQKGGQAASSLDQISKLRNIAVHSESFLYRWQYELLHQLIAGNSGKGGLLRQLFALL